MGKLEGRTAIVTGASRGIGDVHSMIPTFTVKGVIGSLGGSTEVKKMRLEGSGSRGKWSRNILTVLCGSK